MALSSQGVDVKDRPKSPSHEKHAWGRCQVARCFSTTGTCSVSNALDPVCSDGIKFMVMEYATASLVFILFWV